MRFRKRIRDCLLEISEIEGFLISLGNEARHRPLTFAALAQHLLMLGKKTRDESS